MRSTWLWETIAAVAWLLSAPISAQTSSASFVYPPPETTASPRLVINVFDTINLEWTSNYDKAALYLWCDYAPGRSVAWFAQSVNTTGGVSYSPTLQSDTSRDWTNPWACHFDLLYTEDPNRGFLGPEINITSERNKPATTYARDFTSVAVSSAAQVTPSLTSSIASIESPTAGIEELSTAHSSASPSPTSSDSAPATQSSNSSSGLSTGAKAGIAVGIIAAVLSIAGLGFLFYRNNKKLKKLESSMQAQTYSEEYKPPNSIIYAHQQPVEESRPYMPPMELDSHQGTHELPSLETPIRK